MASGNFFKDVFGKAKQKLEGFLYRDDEMGAPAPSTYEDRYPAPPETVYAQQPQTVTYQSQPANYAAYGQPYAAQQPYGNGQMPLYNAPAQPSPYGQQMAYQAAQQQAPMQQQPTAQPQQPVFQATPRNRRAERTNLFQQENNVVDIASYQQPQQPQEQAGTPSAFCARVINARGMSDCRSAITLLRNGDSVLIVLENVTDPAEMRRLVDTLSGACYSLTATITKVSRYGVYLLAPQNVAVYADQVTNQMNSAPARAPMRAAQPAYNAAQGQPYAGAYQPPQAANPYAAPQQNAFMQRPAAPEETMQPFYTRTAPQAGQMPAFSSQPAGYGYAPDETAAVDQ